MVSLGYIELVSSKTWSGEICGYNCLTALKFEACLHSTAAEETLAKDK